MTPRTLRALHAALNSDDVGGLYWDGINWTGYGLQRHGPRVVADLVYEGYLAVAGAPGRKTGKSRRIITDKGRALLTEQRRPA